MTTIVSTDLLWVRPARATSDHRVKERTANKALCGATITPDSLWTTRARKACFACSEILRKDLLADYIEQLLDQMNRPQVWLPHQTWIKVSDRAFDGATPFESKFWDIAGEDNGTIYGEFKPTEVAWPIDLRLITQDEDYPGEHLFVSALKGLDARAVRGKIKPALPYPAMHATWGLRDGFTASTIFGYAGLSGGWVNISGGVNQKEVELREYWDRQIRLKLGIYVFLKTRWRVYISTGNLGVQFPTDSVGVQEVFRLRDIPEGKSRRLAVRHWVTEHWRLNVQDPTEEVKVREHLRGATAFDWSGLKCRITPSDEDLARVYDALIARIQEREAGTDRRPVDDGDEGTTA